MGDVVWRLVSNLPLLTLSELVSNKWGSKTLEKLARRDFVLVLCADHRERGSVRHAVLQRIVSRVSRKGAANRLASSDRSPGSSRVMSGLVDSGAKSWNGRGDVMSGLRSSRNGRGASVRSLFWLALLGLPLLLVNIASAQAPNRGAPKFIPDSSDPAANFLRIAASMRGARSGPKRSRCISG